MQPQLYRVIRATSVGLVMLLLTAALAQGGFSIGATAGLSGEGQAGVNIRAAWAFLELGSPEEPVELAVRADAGFSLSRPGQRWASRPPCGWMAVTSSWSGTT